jgi:cyclophilin family peptidyl-prolyl cis-trans isomerase
VTLRNTGDTAYTLQALQLAFPVPWDATELLDTTGHHLRERTPQRRPFTYGTHLRESRRGRPGADATLLLAAGRPGFGVLQCGDPNGDGSGGPGYSFGPIENAPADNVYPAGTIAMARQGGNGSSMGSQFFIVYEDTTIPADEAGGYTVLGKVTSGLDALKTSVVDAGTEDGSADGKPAIPVTIGTIAVQ